MTAIRDPEQFMAALALANELRTKRKGLKADIASLSRRDAIDKVILLIESPDGVHGGIQIGQLLQAIPMIGEDTSAAILTRAGGQTTPLSSTRKVRALTQRQRYALVMELWRRQS